MLELLGENSTTGIKQTPRKAFALRPVSVNFLSSRLFSIGCVDVSLPFPFLLKSLTSTSASAPHFSAVPASPSPTH